MIESMDGARFEVQSNGDYRRLNLRTQAGKVIALTEGRWLHTSVIAKVGYLTSETLYSEGRDEGVLLIFEALKNGQDFMAPVNSAELTRIFQGATKVLLKPESSPLNADLLATPGKAHQEGLEAIYTLL